MSPFLAWWVMPHYAITLARVCNREAGLRLLDVGTGNHSPSWIRRAVPACRCEGVAAEPWALDRRDEACLEKLHRLDAGAPGALASLPGPYDGIVFSHILEHVASPLDVVRAGAELVRPGGFMLIETPAPRSLSLPRLASGRWGFRGCLNFRDDETHREIVDLAAAARLLESLNWRVEGPRPSRAWRRIIAFPVLAAGCLVVKGFVPASLLWDVTGFASYLVGRRPITV